MSNKKEVPPRYEEIESHNIEPKPEKLSLKDKLSKLTVTGKIKRQRQEEELQNKINRVLDDLFPTVEELESTAKKGRNKYVVLYIKKYAKYNTYHFMNKSKDIKQIGIKTSKSSTIDMHTRYSISNKPDVIEIDHTAKRISYGYLYKYFLNRAEELGLNIRNDDQTITVTW